MDCTNVPNKVASKCNFAVLQVAAVGNVGPIFSVLLLEINNCSRCLSKLAALLCTVMPSIQWRFTQNAQKIDFTLEKKQKYFKY